MRIGIFGTGYVGLVSGACFAERGNHIICVDVDKAKLEKLENGILPIYEPGLEEIVRKCHELGTLRFTTDSALALKESDIIFVAVGTPMGENGSADLQYVLKVAETIGQQMDHPLIIVDKSTVPVGTAFRVRDAIKAELDKRDLDIQFDVISNPEFLAEGHAIEDFMKPSRVVIGSDSPIAVKTMKELYTPFTRSQERFIEMDILSAEMTKYVANSMLATRISFMNDIAGICEKAGADISMVRKGIGSDERIGNKFLYAGPGFGGSCFPKDTLALLNLARKVHLPFNILEAAIDVNEKQKSVILNKLEKMIGPVWKNKRIGILGLAFKPNTDDIRDAPALIIIKRLLSMGAIVAAYDPIATDNVKKFFPTVEYKNSPYEVALDADALLLLTEWNEFKELNMKLIRKSMKKPIFLDGRNMYSPVTMRSIGFKYASIGRQ